MAQWENGYPATDIEFPHVVPIGSYRVMLMRLPDDQLQISVWHKHTGTVYGTTVIESAEDIHMLLTPKGTWHPYQCAQLAQDAVATYTERNAS